MLQAIKTNNIIIIKGRTRMETKGYPEEIDIQKYWLVFKRRWLIGSGVFITCVTLATLAAGLQKPTYEAVGKLLFQSNRASSLTGVGKEIGELESIKNEGSPLDTQAVILQSEPLLRELIEALQLKDVKGKALEPEDILSHIKVERMTGTDVLKLTYKSDNPKQAADGANQLMKSYIANNVLTNRAEVSAAGQFLQQQIPKAKEDLDKAAEELRKFKRRYQIVSLDKQATATVDAITKLNQELNDARTELADVTTRQAAISNQVKEPLDKAISATSLSQIPGVQGALTDLQKIQSQLATARIKYTEEHPALQDLKKQEAALQNILQQRAAQISGSQQTITPKSLQQSAIDQRLTGEFVDLQVKRLGMESKVQTLSTLLTAYRNRADILPDLEKTQGALERQLTVSQKTYENLLSRLQEIKVAESQTVGNARIIQAASTPTKSAGILNLVYIGGGIFVGSFLGIAAAFFVDLIDRRLKTVKEAEAIYGYTLLGLIPKFERNEISSKPTIEGVSPRVIVAGSPRSIIHEAYQMLQTNLKFTSIDKKIKSIAITSSIHGEGKSEVAANLAASMAQSGKKVLLVDGDMRQPSQHHLWGLVNGAGLSNVVAGQSEFSQVVNKVTPNLSVLTAGVTPPNPMALIDSDWMSSMIEMFSREYDCVVFDTPPLVGMAETAVLGKMVDGVLVVTRPGLVDSARATAAKSLLARSEANILGLVANGVNVKHEPDSYFYYDRYRNDQTMKKTEPVHVPQTVTRD
jgi:polysaccharide biosynthesis transport protein